MRVLKSETSYGQVVSGFTTDGIRTIECWVNLSPCRIVKGCAVHAQNFSEARINPLIRPADTRGTQCPSTPPRPNPAATPLPPAAPSTRAFRPRLGGAEADGAGRSDGGGSVGDADLPAAAQRPHLSPGRAFHPHARLALRLAAPVEARAVVPRATRTRRTPQDNCREREPLVLPRKTATGALDAHRALLLLPSWARLTADLNAKGRKGLQ
jgi:hypothetical protein